MPDLRYAIRLTRKWRMNVRRSGADPVVLHPGDNVIGEELSYDDAEDLRVHPAFDRLCKAGVIKVVELHPQREPRVRGSEPSAGEPDEQAPEPGAEAESPELEQAPEWNRRSSLADLQDAARARGIGFSDDATRAELIERLEAFEAVE